MGKGGAVVAAGVNQSSVMGIATGGIDGGIRLEEDLSDGSKAIVDSTAEGGITLRGRKAKEGARGGRGGDGSIHIPTMVDEELQDARVLVHHRGIHRGVLGGGINGLGHGREHSEASGSESMILCLDRGKKRLGGCVIVKVFNRKGRGCGGDGGEEGSQGNRDGQGAEYHG